MGKFRVCLLTVAAALLCVFAVELVPDRMGDRTWHHLTAAPAQYCGTAGQSAVQINADGTLTGDSFCSHLPLVKLETHGQTVTQDAEVVVSMAVVDNGGGHNHLDGEDAFTTDTLMKIRGNSSSRFDKKQYRLTFVENDDPTVHRNMKVMGMPSNSEWVLNGPFLDKTLLRNYLMYNLAGELMDWAPNLRFCEVFLDGKYQGVYIMLEAVKVSEHRVKVTRVVEGRAATGYLVARERVGDTRYPLDNFGTYAGKTYNELGIAYPGPMTLDELRAEYVRQDIGRFEKALYSLDYDEPGRSYREYIDVQSFIDFYLLNEFSMNVDGGGLSTYAHKDLRGKLVMGPVWDFNNGFDNYEYYTLPADEFYLIGQNWFVMLLRDEVFVNETIARYRLLRQGALSEERLMALMDETISFLGPAIERNDTLWGYSYADGWLDNFDTKLRPLDYDRNPRDYEDAVAQLREKIIERGDFMDQYIEVLKQFSAESAVKEWN